MAIRPKRRKSKDNPYTILYCEEENKYLCIFKDNKNIVQVVEITVDVFNAFDTFELEDISQMHKIDKHIEHSEVYEGTLHKRMFNPYMLFEDIIKEKILIENIKRELSFLPEIQKRRVKKYFFENRTMDEIATEEGCSKVAIKYSIDIAINKISKKIKI